MRNGSVSGSGSVPKVEIIIGERLDDAHVDRLSGLLTQALDLRPAELVVDVTDCPFVGAAAIGLLLDAHRRAWGAGTRVTLQGPSARLRSILHAARVDHVLHVRPSLVEPRRSADGRWEQYPAVMS